MATLQWLLINLQRAFTENVDFLAFEAISALFFCQNIPFCLPFSSLCDQGIIVIAGDLFEREEDLYNQKLWKDVAGSEDPELQKQHRATVLELADFIIPGHGKMFAVPMNN